MVNDEDVINDTAKLKIVWTRHETVVRKTMPANHVKQGTRGILRCILAMRATTNPEIIRKSFAITGIYDPKLKGYNIEKVMDQCKEALTKDERKCFRAAIPRLAAINGR